MAKDGKDNAASGTSGSGSPGMNRRDFIRGSYVAFAGAAATAAALSPLMRAEAIPTEEELLQQHYKRLSDEDKRIIFRRLEEDVQREYGVSATIGDPPPMEGVQFAYVLNVGRCIGCRKCVYACMKENNTSRQPQIQYIRVLKMKEGSIDLEASVHDYPDEEAASPDHFYMPVQCQQCRKPPCIEVCPVKATWKEKDGLVVVDYNWCIGCRYCEAACPYHARRFNFAVPKVPEEEINPDMGYLSNRPRPLGVMEKCTFCLHRVRRGRYPACVEVCPVGARKFGNIMDPESEVRKIIEEDRVFVLKQEAGTLPNLYYVFGK